MDSHLLAELADFPVSASVEIRVENGDASGLQAFEPAESDLDENAAAGGHRASGVEERQRRWRRMLRRFRGDVACERSKERAKARQLGKFGISAILNCLPRSRDD